MSAVRQDPYRERTRVFEVKAKKMNAMKRTETPANAREAKDVPSIHELNTLTQRTRLSFCEIGSWMWWRLKGRPGRKPCSSRDPEEI